MIDLHLIRHRGYTTLVWPEDGAFHLKVLGISDGVYGQVDERAKARPHFFTLVEDYLVTCSIAGREPSPPPSNRVLDLLIRAEEADQGKGIDVTGMSSEEFLDTLKGLPAPHLQLCAFGAADSLVVEVTIADAAAAEARRIAGMPDGFDGSYRVPEGEHLDALLASLGLDAVEGAEWYLEMLAP